MNAYETAAKYMAIAQKAGARHSAKDNDLVQQMHDRACELGAKCHCETPTHPMLKAMVYRHPGHPNQKVHGNRFGGFEVTKESLRRLKGDKEAREKYKTNARERSGNPLKGFREDVTSVGGQIVGKWKEHERLGTAIRTENLKPKYRKEYQAKQKQLEGEINQLKRKMVRPGSFIKQQGTSVTGIVTGKGTIKAGKETIPVFQVKLPGGKKSIIPVRDSHIVAI
jgi:hypothetical protein